MLRFPPLICVLLLSAAVRGLPDQFYNIAKHNNNIVGNNAISLPISLDPPLPYYGNHYNYCAVSANGIIEFSRSGPISHSGALTDVLDMFPIKNHTFIAPFYADFDSGGGGMITYNGSVNSSSALEKAREQICISTEYEQFHPKYLIVATWEKVHGYLRENSKQFNTLQCVVATDGVMTFAIFLYDELQWSRAPQSSRPAFVGFNDGTNEAFWEMPCSGTEDIVSLVNTSNVGCDGLWMFRIDGETIEPACTNKETCNGDELCSCLQECGGENCFCKETCSKEDLKCTEGEPDTTPSTPTPVIPTSEGRADGAQNGHPNLVAIALAVTVAIVVVIAVPILRND